jgi:O-antigen ligase
MAVYARPERARPRIVLRSANWKLMAACLGGVLVLSLLGPLMTFSDASSSLEGSSLRQSLSIGLFAVVAVAVKPWDDPRRLLAVPRLIVIALAWFWLSMAWAIEPLIAVRRLILATVVIWSIFLTVRELGYERTLLVLRVVLVGALVANYLTVLADPAFGMHTANEPDELSLIGDWRGFMMHKNLAGPVCVVTLFAFLFDARRIPQWLRWAVVAASAFFLLKSGSKTSFGLAISGVAVGFVFLQYRLRYRSLLIVLVTAMGCAATIVSLIYKNPILGNFSDPKAFTGRPVIWNALTAYIADHPLLGAGYQSFWGIGPGSPVYKYATGFATTVTTGHNGYLDLASQVGIPMMLFAVAAAMVVPLVRLFAAGSANERGALLASILFFLIGANFTETSLFDRDSFMEVSLMLAIALGGALAAQPAMRRGVPVAGPAFPMRPGRPRADA